MVPLSAEDRCVAAHMSENRQTDFVPGPVLHADATCEFTLWAPHSARVGLSIHGDTRTKELTPQDHGYHRLIVPDVQPGMRYVYTLQDGTQRADPASRFQPDGVFGPSEIVDSDAYRWHDKTW